MRVLTFVIFAATMIAPHFSHAQFNPQFSAGASGFGMMGGGAVSYGGVGQMPGSAIDQTAIAMAQYFNWNGGVVGAGVDGKINTPPIGWAAMDNYRQWWNTYDDVRSMNREMQESKSAY